MAGNRQYLSGVTHKFYKEIISMITIGAGTRNTPANAYYEASKLYAFASRLRTLENKLVDVSDTASNEVGTAAYVVMLAASKVQKETALGISLKLEEAAKFMLRAKGEIALPAKAVVAAAKANGVKRVPSPSDAVMWEQWIPKYRRRVEGLLEAPYPKDVKSYAQTLLDLAVRHMGDVPHEKSMMVQAARHLFTALSALQKDNTEAGKQSIFRAALILRGLETGM